MSLQKESLLLFITIIAIFIATTSPTTKARTSGSNCASSCGIGKSARVVQYPFGFSNGCRIQLNCESTEGEIKIGEFQVQNITPNGILVNLPADCSRSIETIRPLFGSNYGPSWKNSLLLQNCSKPSNSCFISRSPFQGELHSKNCEAAKNDNLSCYSLPYSGNDTLSYEDVNSTQCRSVFSSLALGSDSPVVSFQYERIELEWWIEGHCRDNSCSKNGNCSQVNLQNGIVGFRCHCYDGFAGDGFTTGNGCRRVSKCNASRYMSGHCGGTTRVVVLVGGLIAGASLMAVFAVLCYFVRKKSTSMRNRSSAKRLLFEAAGNSSVPFFQYKEIERATNGFSEKQRLGTGAYGTVYAGKLNNDDLVAIKKIKQRDTDSLDLVMNEIKLVSSVSHPNLVRLLGCCLEEGEPILVYEFMPNGTLCQHLQRERGSGLPWTVRLTVAAETANAIAYLHSAVNPPIYHRDIKSSNILLDYNYRSKVADFGLSRLGMEESSHISTAPQGTPGYLDPQYHQYFHLSDKSDVYSFGVVLVEIITAQKVVDFSRPHSEVNLAALAIDRIGRGCVDEIVDPYLDLNRDAWTLSSIHSVAELAFRCLAFHRDMRPSMMEVAEELEQIRLSAWTPAMYMSSPSSSSHFSDHGSLKSLGVSVGKKAAEVASRRLLVPQRADSLASLEEVKYSSPVSVQDPWLSEQSSPSTNSLLGNVVN
ncbi:wall-associated receptor kinase-like 14 isoform X2 [Populus alba x Populus x berolinensis]|nr:wall-associated receptor kinase-like 14 isoform X2 [Populus alba x Populus x berolinensis]